MATADALRVDRDEEALVRRWRTRQFARLGYPLSRARQLADDRSVDWHDVEKLLESGATREDAAELAARD